ncbi:type II toxin-antitoxin system antitoxin DNA ADP-ribosyl glycohydrolase DarG [Xanthomonas campestris]|uniref:type II toxin-antitoxin system antitoxin DNA ADP-ribosyl glycohydrolase DarG n=1 Tax=Xanthomonas campestris TaxID=339 RepID=UPI0009BF2947|nr:macro domain-containing protein [Xanthomonas campestris]MCF8869723.1 macro domain-containing protein [Xanthomonas campestris pv. campestris]MDM7697528.1 macro domain-containing protein [Xanthomonas campestris pv. campestris]MEA0928186.1 macro domain-containing protein [Xanthomonas campestris pv. campestris]MEA9837363.1 macro domain-containing protein [Xanthomonas campestris pv. raphani]MEB1361259.1 macro domain-containing protein [Xanthomonas campestris pv. campestris]
MSILFENGNLFESTSEAIVNTVNCVGVMGKGVALEFKKRWPENYKFYKKACDAGALRPGTLLIFDRNSLLLNPTPRFLINFPTKDHWRAKSRIEYIELGLNALVEDIRRLGISSVAIPPLGCGNGGLDWDLVRPLIVSKLSELPNVNFSIYGPAPTNETAEFARSEVRLTAGQALYLRSISALEDRLDRPIDRLSLQKIAYFLQVLGVQLNLNFEDSLYGPYSEKLKKALFAMNRRGLLSGFDQIGRYSRVTATGFASADDFLRSAGCSEDSVERLLELVTGFESPYGLELLSTVHYYTSNPEIKFPGGLVEYIHSLSSYRRNSYAEKYILDALQKLKISGLVPLELEGTQN